MHFIVYETTLIIGIFAVIIGLLAIILVQFFRIRMFRRLFRELFSVFARDKKLDYHSLVERIIHSKEFYRAGPSIEVIDLISRYIQGIIGNSRVFIHVTPDQVIAESIMKEGFKYSEDFHKSSEEISSDLSDLAYKLQIYRPYGKYVMILCIPRNLFKEMNSELITGSNDFLAECGISEYNPGDELSYILPPKYVCGYADIENLKIVENKFFRSQL
jgi:hypothetical protein